MGNPTIVGRIAEWTTETHYAGIPREVVEQAKNQVLSMIAATHAGHFSEVGRIVSRTVKGWGAAKEATLIPSGERTSVHCAIFGNAALSMALEYDDYLFAAHTGHSAVLVTFALAEKIGISGKDFILAQVLANEVEGRVGAAVLGDPIEQQLRSFIHLVGGAVIAAKLLGLDRQGMEHAIGISMLQPNLGVRAGFFGSDAKVLMGSMTAPLGVQAAELAAGGLHGPDDVFEGEHGLATIVGGPLLNGAFGGLGSVWLTDALSYKIYPGCVYIDACIDCILSLTREHHIDARRVQVVHIAAGPLTLRMDALSAPYMEGPDSRPSTLHFCTAYNAAVALIDRDLSPRQFTRDRIRDSAVWQLASKVRVSLDESRAQQACDWGEVERTGKAGERERPFDLETADLRAFNMAFGATVRIELNDGRSFERTQDVPYGSSARPLDERRRLVEEKFRRETRYTLRKERMEKAIDLVSHLEQLNASQVRELVRLCCSERD